ncbi:DOMON domain-containing protein [Chloroflexota bacterium]
MKRLFTLTGVITLAIIGLIFTAGCESSPQETPLPAEAEAPVVSPGLPPDLPKSGQPPPGERWSPDGVLGDNEYLGEKKYGDYEIRWMTDGEYAYFGIRARTTGWVAIGFNPSSGMKDADMIFGMAQDSGITISDQFSTGTFGPHNPDIELGGTNDIFKSGGNEEGGFTTIEFARPLNTGDSYDSKLSRGPIDIIWAYGSNDEFNQKHIARGNGEITL